MRVVYFIIVAFLSVTLPWWLVLPMWAVYALFYPALELVLLGMLLDAYVGHALPWHVFYTVVAAALCICMEWLKPRMAFYEERA